MPETSPQLLTSSFFRFRNGIGFAFEILPLFLFVVKLCSLPILLAQRRTQQGRNVTGLLTRVNATPELPDLLVVF